MMEKKLSTSASLNPISCLFLNLAFLGFFFRITGHHRFRRKKSGIETSEPKSRKLNVFKSDFLNKTGSNFVEKNNRRKVLLNQNTLYDKNGQ